MDSRNFGDVTQTFSKGVVTATDLSSLLEKIETDLSLVHAAYYTDDECIERIADWIAGKAQTIEIEGAPTDTVHLAVNSLPTRLVVLQGLRSEA